MWIASIENLAIIRGLHIGKRLVQLSDYFLPPIYKQNGNKIQTK